MDARNSPSLESPVIRLHKNDNVVVARRNIEIDEYVSNERLKTHAQVPAGYKIATTLIKQGEPVRKYNVVIGFATEDIIPGEIAHTQNIVFRDYDRDYAHATEYQPVDILPLKSY